MSAVELNPIEDPLLDPGEDEPATESVSWPRARLISAVATIALACALALPLVLAAPSPALILTAAFPVALATLAARWSFDSRRLRRFGHVTLGVLVATLPAAALGCAIVLGVSLVLGTAGQPLGHAVSFILTVVVIAAAAAARAVEVRVSRASRRVFLVSSQAQARDMTREARRHGAMDVVGFAPATGLTSEAKSSEQLLGAVRATNATSLVLSAEATRDANLCAAAARINVSGCRVRELTRFYEEQFRKVPVSDLNPTWFLFDIADIHRPRSSRFFKRAAEVALAVGGLVVTAPLFVLIAVAVKATSPGPVLFRQQRVGLHDQPFTMLKFRTMTERPADAAASWAGADAARITAVGHVLRKYRLDELPQLVNVLAGQLSLIGPRPEQVALVRELEAKIPYYGARHSVRPGLTGWAQVNAGYSGSFEGTREKLQYDFFYIKHQSVRLDLLILVTTFKTVLLGRGLY